MVDCETRLHSPKCPPLIYPAELCVCLGVGDNLWGSTDIQCSAVTLSTPQLQKYDHIAFLANNPHMFTISITSYFKYLYTLFCQESIVDEEENQKDENIHLKRFLIVLANFLIFCCLAGSGYLIFYVVRKSQTYSKVAELTWYQKNEVSFPLQLLT